MKSIIELAMIFLMIAFAKGKVPEVIKNTKKAQLYLLKESSSTNWGKVWTPSQIAH